jgi:cobalt-precorrin-6B (C15)-methyltransferase
MSVNYLKTISESSLRMPSALWPYLTPGIPDELFERLPGIPLSQREVRLLILAHLRLLPDAVVWDIGAGTGTIAVEVGLLCPNAQIIAIERDEEVASLIRRNCDRFGVKTVEVIEGSAPECLESLTPPPSRVCLEGGRNIKTILRDVWRYLEPQGRLVTTASSLEGLYAISESFSELQVRNIEVVQSAVNRLETRGTHQTFAATDPMFVLSGEKLE